MSKYVITPWRTPSDLLEVRSQLYRLNTNGSDQRRYAVDRVMAWKLRGNLPHAVESTALLVDAILHHHQPGSLNSVFSIRAVYSAAFTRFVTGFCDIGRARERMLEPSSMLEIAKQIDMPGEFVALRHEATHEEIPSVQRLVEATNEALDWLWKVYWRRLEEPQQIMTAGQAEIDAFKVQARKMLKEYRNLRRAYFRSDDNASQRDEPHRDQTEILAKRCRDLCKDAGVETEALSEVLVDEKLLLPSNRQLDSPMAGAFMIWDELLNELADYVKDFAPALIRSMLGPLSKDTQSDGPAEDAGCEGWFEWLKHVVDYNAGLRCSLPVKKALRKDIIKCCCLHPGRWTGKLGLSVLETDDEGFRERWQDLLEASRLRDAGEAAPDAALDNRDPDFQIDPSGDIVVDKKEALDLTEAETRAVNWVRAAMPPSVPIGVV